MLDFCDCNPNAKFINEKQYFYRMDQNGWAKGEQVWSWEGKSMELKDPEKSWLNKNKNKVRVPQPCGEWPSSMQRHRQPQDDQEKEDREPLFQYLIVFLGDCPTLRNIHIFGRSGQGFESVWVPCATGPVCSADGEGGGEGGKLAESSAAKGERER